MTKAQLRKRWSDPALALAVNAVVRTVEHSGTPLSPFADYGSRVDLRGFTFPDGARISGLRLSRVDLSCGRMKGALFEKCWFSECIFDSADLAGMTDRQNVFENCSFEQTSMQRSSIGHGGSKYLHCRFVNTNLRNAVFVRAEFDETRFDSCALRGVDFNASSFVNCVFSGPLEQVWFRGRFALATDAETFGTPRPNTMRSVSFADAELRSVTFSNECDLSTVVVPSSGACYLVDNWRNRLEQLGKELRDWPEPGRSQALDFIEIHMVHAVTQDWYIVCAGDVAELSGKEAAPLIMRQLRLG